MKLVVGLGNPGSAYVKTPHNIGFDVVARLAQRWECQLSGVKSRFNARVASARVGGETVWLAEPQTYMNNSGLAVSEILRFHRAVPADLIVVLDDVALPLGRVRIRSQGGSGGHRGLASIIEHVGADAFARLRIGIGGDAGGGDLADYVLKPFNRAEQEQMLPVIDRAVDAVVCMIESGVAAAMNRYNAFDPSDDKDAEL